MNANHNEREKICACSNIENSLHLINDMNVEIILMKMNFDERVRRYDSMYNMQ